MYVVFNAELNGTIGILCFCRTIIDLLWPSKAVLGHSRSIMAWRRKHKIMMVPFNSALKTTYLEKSGFYILWMKTLSFFPSSHRP